MPNSIFDWMEKTRHHLGWRIRSNTVRWLPGMVTSWHPQKRWLTQMLPIHNILFLSRPRSPQNVLFVAIQHSTQSAEISRQIVFSTEWEKNSASSGPTLLGSSSSVQTQIGIFNWMTENSPSSGQATIHDGLANTKQYRALAPWSGYLLTSSDPAVTLRH